MNIIYPYFQKIYDLLLESRLKFVLYLTITFFLFFGIFLRFQYLDKTFWLDEWLTIEKVMLMFKDHTANPYHIMNYIFIRIFGISEIYLRLFSVFFSLLTMLGIYLVSKKFFNKYASFLAAVLFSVFPINIILGQEVRMYSLLSFFSILHLYYFLFIISKLFFDKLVSHKIYLFYFFTTSLMLFTHFSGSIVVMSETLAISIILFSKKNGFSNFKKVFLVNLFSVVIFVIWDFKNILVKFGFFASDNTYIEKFLSSGNILMDIFLSLFNVTFGLSFLSVICLVFLVVILFLFWFFRIIPIYSHVFSKSKSVIFFKFVTYTILIYFVINYSLGTFVPRHFFVVSSYIAIIFGSCLSFLFNRSYLLGSIVIFCVLFVSSVNSIEMQENDAKGPSRRWVNLANYINTIERGNDSAILVSVPYINGLFKYYYHGSIPIIEDSAYKENSENELIKNNEIGVSFFNENIINEIMREAKKHTSLIVVNSEGDLMLSDSQGLLGRSLSTEFDVRNETCFPKGVRGLCIVLYSKKM
jgi:mannosyltransferase